MNYVIGIDLGTSGVKGLLLSENGTIERVCSASHKPDYLGKGFVEQDPSVWWENTKKVIKLLAEETKGKITAISCSGQMHSSVFLDSAHKVIRPAILWNDTRTTAQTKEIYTMAGGKEKLLEQVYNNALEGFTLPKILWLKENEPENFKKVCKVIMPKDYINFMLTGNIFTDVSDAAGTLLYDVKENKWSDALLGSVGLNKDILPECLESTGTVGCLTADVAAELGLDTDVKVIAGGADNSCAAIGNGVVEAGQAVLSVGTSGTVVAFLDGINKKTDGSVHLFNYSYPNSVYAMGVMLSAGESLNWLKANIFPEKSFDELNELAQKAAAGSGGLIFLPYLFGERCPYSDANAKGVFFGLSGLTAQGEMVRAVMEGVAFGFKDLFKLVSSFTDIKEIYITGGGAKSEVWGQIISDIIQREVHVLNVEEGPAFGAALIAGVGASVFGSFNEAKEKAIKVVRSISPNKQNNEKYEKIYEIYQELYKANVEIYKKLGDL